MLSNATEHTAAGLAPSFRGTYVIVEKVSENTYKIADEDGNILGDFNVKQMRPRFELNESESESGSAHEEEPAQPTSSAPSVTIANKPKRGRPCKKKKGPPRKTVLAPKKNTPPKTVKNNPAKISATQLISPGLNLLEPGLGRGKSPEKPVPPLTPKTRARTKSA